MRIELGDSVRIKVTEKRLDIDLKSIYMIGGLEINGVFSDCLSVVPSNHSIFSGILSFVFYKNKEYTIDKTFFLDNGKNPLVSISFQLVFDNENDIILPEDVSFHCNDVSFLLKKLLMLNEDGYI